MSGALRCIRLREESRRDSNTHKSREHRLRLLMCRDEGTGTTAYRNICSSA